MQSTETLILNHRIVQTGRFSAKSYQFESGSPFSSSQSIQVTVTEGDHMFFFA